jgi:hypothetical protein
MGPTFKVPDWIALVTRDCPRRQSPGLADACAAQCPGLLGLPIEVASQNHQDRATAAAAGVVWSKID